MSSDNPDRTTPFEDDLIVHKFINPKFLEVEVELFRIKWFDYRFLTPLQATWQYIDIFGDVYREFYRLNFDVRASEFITVPTADKVIAGLEKSDDKIRKMFPSFWRGRQVADAIGMPYRTFLNIAFEKRLSYWNRPFMPNARHLYSEMIAVAAQERWEELQRARLFTSDLPAYLTQNYQNSDMQNDYHEWLFLQASYRGNRTDFFVSRIEADALPLSKVLARVDADKAAEIQQLIAV